MLDRLLSVQEVAELLGVSVHTVYAWVSAARLPFVKVGTRTKFRQSEILRWVAERSRAERESPDQSATAYSSNRVARAVRPTSTAEEIEG